MAALAALSVLGGCRSDALELTAPGRSAELVPCDATGTITLSRFQDTTVDCSASNALTLAGRGASYLVVPEFATGDVPDNAVPYVIGTSPGPVFGAGSADVGVAGAGVADMGVADMGVAGAAVFSPQLMRLPRGGAAQAGFDARLMATARRELASGRWHPATAPAGAAGGRSGVSGRSGAGERLAALTPPLYSLRTFSVLSSTSGSGGYKKVSARLDYAGSRLLLYVDTAAPQAGLSTTALHDIGRLFDGTLYPLALNAFGAPTDIDGNGHIIMLMSPVVNALTSASQCASQGFLVGFFNGLDLGNPGDSHSNRGEIIYTIVPDPDGTLSCPHSLADFMFSVPATFLHEVQHLISFSQHVVVHGGKPEAGWLDEGLSFVAEELGAIHYEKKYPPPTGRTNPDQLFPDSAEGFMADAMYDSYAYLRTPGTESITTHADSDPGVTWRGGAWLLARWLGDHYGASVYRRLDQGSLTGVANIEAATGTSFPALFGHFGLALYADSMPGHPRDAAPALDRFTSRNLRQLYQALYNAAGAGGRVPQPFPIDLNVVGPGNTKSASLDPGTLSFYRVNTFIDSATITIRFTTPSGSPLNPALKPQVSVLRLPD